MENVGSGGGGRRSGVNKQAGGRRDERSFVLVWGRDA